MPDWRLLDPATALGARSRYLLVSGPVPWAVLTWELVDAVVSSEPLAQDRELPLGTYLLSGRDLLLTQNCTAGLHRVVKTAEANCSSRVPRVLRRKPNATQQWVERD